MHQNSSTDGLATLPDSSLYSGFANSEAALTNEGGFARPGDKDPAHSEGGVANGRRLCQYQVAALPRRPSWSFAFVRGC